MIPNFTTVFTQTPPLPCSQTLRHCFIHKHSATAVHKNSVTAVHKYSATAVYKHSATAVYKHSATALFTNIPPLLCSQQPSPYTQQCPNAQAQKSVYNLNYTFLQPAAKHFRENQRISHVSFQFAMWTDWLTDWLHGTEYTNWHPSGRPDEALKV